MMTSMMESNLRKLFRCVIEKSSQAKGNLRLRVLLQSQYDFLYCQYLAGRSSDNLYYTSVISRTGIPDSRSISVSNRDESSEKNIASKRRKPHSKNMKRQNKRLKTSDSASPSINAERLTNSTNNQNSNVQAQKRRPFSRPTWQRSQTESEHYWKPCSEFSKRHIMHPVWIKSMLQDLSDWFEECGINVYDEERYFSPYLNHPINNDQRAGILNLCSKWQAYYESRSKGMTQFQQRKNSKILLILNKLVQQYRDYQETNGDNEILNLQLRKNRCKLKKLAKKLFDFQN